MNRLQKRNIFLSISVIIFFYIISGWLLSVLNGFDTMQNTALIVSGILCTVNIVLSFIILIAAYDKDIKGFMVQYFGGMAIRLLFLLLSIFLILKFSRIDIFVFILSLFVLYFIFQMLEIYFIHSYQKRK